MLFAFIAVLRLVSLAHLRREGFPQVPIKVAVIQTTYKGAGPGEVERSVTNPIEAALKGNKNINEFSSQSQDNVSIITASLEASADLNSAIQDINSVVAGVELPKEADKPKVFQPATGNAAFIYGISGSANTADLVRDGKIFQQELAQVPGIKEVKPTVDAQQKVKIDFDATKLSRKRVDMTKLSDTISGNNINLPAGKITSGNVTMGILFAGRYESVAQLSDVRLPIVGGGEAVRLADVATIQTVVDTKSRFLYRFYF